LFGSSLVLVTRSRHTVHEVRAAIAAIDAVVESEVGRRVDRGHDGEDILSAIVRAWRARRDEVSREELLSLIGMLLLAGFETTAQMLSLAMVAVLTHPHLLDGLRRDPAAVPDALEELLRWDSPGPFTRRIALEDIELGGVVIPAGSRVMLSLLAANRDPEGRPDPDTLDPERIEGGHLTFGLGPHYCLGAPLARIELTVALSTLLCRCPDLTLAVPAAELPWEGSHLHRGLSALPVLPSGPRP
jgi:cytochrome P450